MKGYKIDLRDYEFPGLTGEVNVGQNLAFILFANKVTARESVKMAILADKLEEVDEIVLSEADYDKLLKACESPDIQAKRPHVPMFERVFNAEVVELEEKKNA